MLLRNVEIFCDVASCRSFSKAAEAHEVSQSSASQAVSMLEKRLGTLLIDRSKRPLELTSAGQVYFDGCRELLEGFRRVEERVRGAGDKVVGRVRVAAIYSVGLLQTTGAVRRFREACPDASLTLEYLHPDDVYARVLNDEADLGLVSFPRDGGEIGCVPWQEQAMGLVVAPDHPYAGRKSVPVSALSGQAFVAFSAELTIRRHVDRWLRGARVAVDVVHAFDNVENIKRAVEIGAGISLLPLPTVRREVETGSLAAVPLEDVRWTRPLGIVHRRHRALSAAARRFVELLRSVPDGNGAGASVPGEASRVRNGTEGRGRREGRTRTAVRTGRGPRAVSESGV
jgi:DNA-binding transcriptional LysR family regulator